MIIIAYSETDEERLESRLGRSEYSYYFVLSAFRPVLEQLGTLILVRDPEREVDPIFHAARERGEDCVFLSFSPPHRTPLGLDCPTIPVFAWEFDTIPSETWFGERQQDWRFVLNALGRAITHCEGTVATVRDMLGQDFPIASIPAPVWDRFAPLRYRRPVAGEGAMLSLTGLVIDSRNFDLSHYDHAAWNQAGAIPLPPEAPASRTRTDLAIEGVAYVSIFNPWDARKNWEDLMGGFCWALREAEDATLILKLTHSRTGKMLSSMLDHLNRHRPFKCRVVIQNGYLDRPDYEALVAATRYAVNTSRGEGQCLPLMEAMAAGRPAVAPRHTGMADYVSADNAFLVGSSAEPGPWPHDPRQARRAMRQRIDLESLVEAYRQSYRTARDEPDLYARMGDHAHEAMRRHCSNATAAERLTELLRQPLRPAEPSRDYGRIKPRFDAPWISDTSSAEAS